MVITLQVANNQVPHSVLWFPDLRAVANDAFSLSWEQKDFFAFSQFSLIRTALNKI